jgi:hypothetical protein
MSGVVSGCSLFFPRHWHLLCFYIPETWKRAALKDFARLLDLAEGPFRKLSQCRLCNVGQQGAGHQGHGAD